VSAVKTKNVTLSLPEPLMRRFKVFAAEKDKSMSALMAELLETAIDSDSAHQAAARRFLNRARNAPNLGTGGKITWKREDLDDR
jgi:hypothetical protein